MEANELRIGNYVEVENYKIIQLENIHPKGTEKEGEVYLISMLKPIPLTEEWLLRFGFSPMSESEYTLNTYELYGFQLWNKNGDFSEIVFFARDKSIVIRTVHQLQNLYFVLCGEELTIKTSHL